jgi:hypothetical protein
LQDCKHWRALFDASTGSLNIPLSIAAHGTSL